MHIYTAHVPHSFTNEDRGKGHCPSHFLGLQYSSLMLFYFVVRQRFRDSRMNCLFEFTPEEQV